MCNLNLDGKIVTYAVDTCLIFTDLWISVQHKAISELKNVVNLFNLKKLSLHIKKRIFMTLSIYNIITQFSNFGRNLLYIFIKLSLNTDCNDELCKIFQGFNVPDI